MSKFFADAFRKFVGGFGWIGVAFIGYSMNAELNGHRFPFLEKWGPLLSTFFTLLGTLLTALSIYFYAENSPPNRPEPFSLWISAPIVILGCLLAMWLLYVRGDLPVMLLNGFAMLGLAGALFRIQVNPGDIR
jgi:hypothetical protein